jgi:hypothetical protein
MRRTIIICIVLIGLVLAAMLAIGLLWPDSTPTISDTEW